MAYTRLVLSGDLLETYEYQFEPNPDRLVRAKKPRRHMFPQERREDSIKACRKAFTRLVRANLSPADPPALCTLTMTEIVDISEAYREYTLFVQRLTRKYAGSRVISVPEFQQRGAVHFHMLVWGLPSALPCLLSRKYYVDKTGKKHRKHVCPSERFCERHTRSIANLWGAGFVDIVETDGAPQLSTYLAKYMAKAMHDKRLIGKRAYSSTRNVLRSSTFNSPLEISYAQNELGWFVDKTLDKVSEYDTLFLGKCVYKQLTTKHHESSESPIDTRKVHA